MNRTVSATRVALEVIEEIDEDWEEYNPSKGPFVAHMIAGSIAGLAEHGIVYPIDTVKTFYQARYDSAGGETTSGKKALMNTWKEGGFRRMYRGIFAVILGVVPAHSAYFSIYEVAKEQFGANRKGHHPLAAAASGAAAVIAHDMFMTPLDVVKQRLQLGCICQNTNQCYNGVADCALGIVREEGYIALFRSLPTTMLMNIPYSAVNVAVNESARRIINPSGNFDTKTFLSSGAIAGAVAALFTNPLDVAKTRLQTQSINFSALGSSQSMKKSAGTSTRGLSTSVGATAGAFENVRTTHFAVSKPTPQLRYKGLFDTMKRVAREEGASALMRGSMLRMVAHAPAVGVSWTAYEYCKTWLTSPGSIYHEE